MTIPSGLRRPDIYTDINTNTQRTGLPDNRQRVLFVTDDTPLDSNQVLPVALYDKAKARTVFGASSTAERMITAALKTNTLVDVEAINQVVTSSSDTINVSILAASGNGDPIYYAGAALNNPEFERTAKLSFKINGGSVQTLSVSGYDFEAGQYALECIGPNQPVVSVTDNFDGLALANIALDVQLNLLDLINGTSFTIALTRLSNAVESVEFVASTTGVGDIDIADNLGLIGMYSFGESSLFDTIAPLGHTIITLSDSLTTQAEALAWAQHLEFVSGPTEQHDAILVVPFTEIEDAEAFAALASAKTSYRIVAACYHGATGQEAEIAASIAAALADSADPALPFNGVNLTGLTPVEPAYVLTKTRIEQALHNGVCMIATGADGVPEIVRAVTTYQQTPEGEEDDLLLDVNGALVLAYVRKTMRSIAKAQPRRKNTASTRRDVRSAFLAGCMKLDEAEILKNVNARKDALTVDADVNDEYRVNARIPSDWVRGMHIIATTLDVF